MTTIIWHDGFLYCDSQVKILDDTLQTLTKARGLAKPVPVHSQVQDLDDQIYGFIVTGLMEAGQGFIATLLWENGDLDNTLTLYNWAQRSYIINDSFTVMLFGGKSIYLFTVNASKVEWKVESPGTSLGLGSGGKSTMDEIKKGSQPIRAMYKTFLIDPDTNGGIIDVWRHEPEKGHFFHRYGIINAVAAVELPEKLQDMKAPVQLDLLSKQALDDLMPDMSAEDLEKLNKEWARRRFEQQKKKFDEEDALKLVTKGRKKGLKERVSLTETIDPQLE